MKRKFVIGVVLAFALAGASFAGTVKRPGGTATYPDAAVGIGSPIFELKYYYRQRGSLRKFRTITWTYKGIEEGSIIVHESDNFGGKRTQKVPLTGRSKNVGHLSISNDFNLDLTVNAAQQITVTLHEKRPPASKQ